MTISELLTLLPRLETREDGLVDFGASDVVIVALIAEASELACRTLMRGLAAMGGLMAHAGPEIEDGTVTPADFEALGLLIAEVGGMAETLSALSFNCTRAVRGNSRSP